MKKIDLEKRLARLKKEAIKKMKEQGIYKGPQDGLVGVDSNKKNPDKEKIKTEIKLTSKSLKEYLADVDDVSVDLDSIFSTDEGSDVDEDLDLKSIDSLLADLDEDDVAEVGPEVEPEAVDGDEVQTNPAGEACPEGGPLRDGHGDGQGQGRGQNGEPEDIDEVEISTPEVQKRLKNIVEDIQTIKVKMLQEAEIEELNEVFSFKIDEDEVQVDDEDGDEIIASLDNIFSEVGDDVSDDDLNNMKEKINSLFQDIDGEGLANDELDSIFAITEDEPATIANEEEMSLDSIFSEDDESLNNLDNDLLDNIFSEDDGIDIDQDDIVI